MTCRLQQPTLDDAIDGLPTVIDPHGPVSVPSDTDLGNPAAIEHAAPAFSPRKSNIQIKKPTQYVVETG